jgi:signal transduction histidine kinase
MDKLVRKIEVPLARKRMEEAGLYLVDPKELERLANVAMDAYKDQPGNIDIKVREDDTKVYINITDYAGGIPQKVQEKLFKEMITSKGKNGTGLGLYMSFSTIKGKFKGDIRFETEEGKGTTFFIELPKYVG